MGKQKILVEIIGDYGIKKKKKYVIEDNKVIIDDAKRKGGAGWKPEFDRDCILPYEVGHLFWKRLKRKLMVMENANKCISFKDGEAQIPIWDRETEGKFFEASVIKHAGATVQKVKISVWLYMLVFACLIMDVLVLLVLSGRVRIV